MRFRKYPLLSEAFWGVSSGRNKPTEKKKKNLQEKFFPLFQFHCISSQWSLACLYTAELLAEMMIYSIEWPISSDCVDLNILFDWWKKVSSYRAS